MATLEKAIVQGKPVLVRGIQDKLNQLAMPLLYHYSTLTEDHINKGVYDFLFLTTSVRECNTRDFNHRLLSYCSRWHYAVT